MLKPPATADEWLAGRAGELDRRLERFSRRLLQGELEGVELRDGRLHVITVNSTTKPEARAFADGIEAMMPPARITELLHEVNRLTGFASAFANLRTGERCNDVNARYGHDPGQGFYTHVSDQHGRYSVRVMSAASHEAPYVLTG